MIPHDRYEHYGEEHDMSVSQSEDRVAAQDVQVGDLISMQTNEYWSRWGYVTRIGCSSTGGTVYFSGETDRGERLHLTKRATTIIARKGHRRAKEE